MRLSGSIKQQRKEGGKEVYDLGEETGEVFEVGEIYGRRVANDEWRRAAGKTVSLAHGDLKWALGIKGSAVRCRRCGWVDPICGGFGRWIT